MSNFEDHILLKLFSPEPLIVQLFAKFLKRIRNEAMLHRRVTSIKIKFNNNAIKTLTLTHNRAGVPKFNNKSAG